jgi:DNA-directed RNA polymerase subunit RPC12/RpoP
MRGDFTSMTRKEMVLLDGRIGIVQESLDAGLNFSEAEKSSGVSRRTIGRMLEKGEVEIYTAFDEYEDLAHLSQNFEWLWEADQLENVTNKAFEDGYYLINLKDADDYRWAKYVRDDFGDIQEYLKIKKLDHLLDVIYIMCSDCGKEVSIGSFHKHRSRPLGITERCPECAYKLRERQRRDNPDKVVFHNNKRRMMQNSLPFLITFDSFKKIFTDTCFITGEKGVHVDHFIPVSWGHGGTYIGNLALIPKKLNLNKKDKNPFVWFKGNINSSRVRFNKLVSDLSKQNRLTPQEFESFVNWCDDNRRTVEEVRQDTRPSIEIWRAATRQHFPLPKYVIDAMNEIGNRPNNEKEVV